jgi:hypothetical protein
MASEITATSRKVYRRRKSHNVQRLFYRRGHTADELDRLVEEIGPLDLWAALDRYTRPVMAE